MKALLLNMLKKIQLFSSLFFHLHFFHFLFFRLMQTQPFMSQMWHLSKQIITYMALTWAWREDERLRFVCDFQKRRGPGGFGSCREAEPCCSSSAQRPPAPQPPPVALPAGSAAPDTGYGPSAPPVSAAALRSPPAEVEECSFHSFYMYVRNNIVSMKVISNSEVVLQFFKPADWMKHSNT